MTESEIRAISTELDALKDQIREEMYELAKSEYYSAWEDLKKQQSRIDSKMSKWETIIEILRRIMLQTGENLATIDYKVSDYDSVRFPEDDDSFINLAYRYMVMGRDFDKILSAINENPILKHQWDKLLMAMRLTDPK